MQYISNVRIIVCILAICATAKKLDPHSLLNTLVEKGGEWVLAAAAATHVPPPYRSCVNMTVTLLPDRSECIVSNLNLTPRFIPTVKIVGINQEGDVEIRTVGPINEYMIKRRKEESETDKLKKTLIETEMNWESAVNRPLCWQRGRWPRRLLPLRYVIAPVDKTRTAIYIVGIKMRFPFPEYEHGILTKGIRKRNEVERMINVINWRNFDKMSGCRENIGFRWNRSQVAPYFEYCLPRLHIKCATGYDVRDNADAVNDQTPHQIFYSIAPKPSYPNSAETESIVIKHN